MSEERQIEMLPEQVDRKLARWSLAGRDQGGELTCGKDRDIQAEFLAATKLRCFPSCPSARSPQPPHIHESIPVRFSPKILRYPDLPLDVILEIAAYVHPLDLIHLSHTSKQLRRLFMSNSSRTTWKIVLGDIPELPPCPEDMCEPLYAALVFGRYCFGCGTEDAFWVDYALRLRLCEPCYKANVVEGTEVLKFLPQESVHTICDVLLMLVSSANSFNFGNLAGSFERINPLYRVREDFYFKPELEAMLRLLWPVPAPKDVVQLKELMKIRANYVMMRQMHAVLIHAWDNLCAEPASESDFFRIKSLYRSVQSLQTYGCDWGEVCAPENPVFASYLSEKGSEENEMSNLRGDPPKSQAQLAMELHTLAQRETAARIARVRVRRAQVKDWHRDIVELHPDLPDDGELPNAYDTSRLWWSVVIGPRGDAYPPLDRDSVVLNENFVKGFIVGPLVAYRLRVVRSLAAEVEQYERRRAEEAQTGNVKGRRRSKTRRGVRTDVDVDVDVDVLGEPWKTDWQDDPEALLVRPTALFVCRECGAYPYAYPKINVHWQEAHPEQSVWTEAGRGFGGVGEYGAEVWEDGAEVGEKILAVLVEKGLPENKRDVGSLDKLIEEGRVFCACGDPTMATPESEGEELGWETLVDHVFNHLNDNMLRRTTTLASQSNDAPVWLDDHDLTSCIRYLPEDADTSEANKRVVADESTRARIDALLRQCPETSSPACRLCDALTPDNRKDDSLFLTASAHAIVYHMGAKHGRGFDEENIAFWNKSAFDRP